MSIEKTILESQLESKSQSEGSDPATEYLKTLQLTHIRVLITILKKLKFSKELIGIMKCFLELNEAKSHFAVKRLMELSKPNHPKAINAKGLLAYCYAHGVGVPEDISKAVALVINGHELGSMHATAILGNHLVRGIGIERNIPEGLKLLNAAARSGSFLANGNLYDLYAIGTFVDQDLPKAISHLKKAAKIDPFMQTILAERYLNGVGVKQNIKKVVKYFQKGAEGGDLNAQLRLAEIYENPKRMGHEEITPNPFLAFQYYLKASEVNDKNAVEKVKQLSNYDEVFKAIDPYFATQKGFSQPLVRIVTSYAMIAKGNEADSTKGKKCIIM